MKVTMAEHTSITRYLARQPDEPVIEHGLLARRHRRPLQTAGVVLGEKPQLPDELFEIERGGRRRQIGRDGPGSIVLKKRDDLHGLQVKIPASLGIRGCEVTLKHLVAEIL